MKRQYWTPKGSCTESSTANKKNKEDHSTTSGAPANKTAAKAASLNKNKKREVYSLEKNCDAWNIDGSSTDLPPQCSSWIAFWESKTGLKRGICSYSDCNKPAVVGGHIWLKRKGPHIAPICSGCNHVENVERFQADDGTHSSFRQGTTLVRVKLTEDMKNADRRIATYQLDSEYEEESSSESESEEDSSDESECQYMGSFRGHFGSNSQFGSLRTRSCLDCNRDISESPMHHTKCLECFRGSRLPENEEDSSDESECQYMGSFRGHFGSNSQFGSLRTRSCLDCNRDISESPMHHTKCLECFRGSRLPESEEDSSDESECVEFSNDQSECEEDSNDESVSEEDESESEEESTDECEDFDYY